MNTSNAHEAVISCSIFLLFLLLSQLGLHLYHRWIGRQNQARNNEVSGIIFGGVSLIYSLILAFVIVAVWQNYEALNRSIRNETSKINGIVAHSLTLSDDLRRPIDSALSSYCRQVVNKEWLMNKADADEQPSAIPTLRLILLKQDPKDREQQAIFAVLDEDLSSISELERTRLSHNRSQVPELVWLILESGSIMLILFSYFFYVPSLRLKRIYLFFLSGCIGMSMLLLYELDHPFSGIARVSSNPYSDILKELERPIACSGY